MLSRVTDWLLWSIPYYYTHGLPGNIWFPLWQQQIRYPDNLPALIEKYPGLGAAIQRLYQANALHTHTFHPLLRKYGLHEEIARGLIALCQADIHTPHNCETLAAALPDRYLCLENLLAQQMLTQIVFDCLVKHQNNIDLAEAITCLKKAGIFTSTPTAQQLESLVCDFHFSSVVIELNEMQLLTPDNYNKAMQIASHSLVLSQILHLLYQASYFILSEPQPVRLHSHPISAQEIFDSMVSHPENLKNLLDNLRELKKRAIHINDLKKLIESNDNKTVLIAGLNLVTTHQQAQHDNQLIKPAIPGMRLFDTAAPPKQETFLTTQHEYPVQTATSIVNSPSL